jgi:hypothetical protein
VSATTCAWAHIVASAIAPVSNCFFIVLYLSALYTDRPRERKKLVVASSADLIQTYSLLAPGSTLYQAHAEWQPFSTTNCGIFPKSHAGATQAVSNGLLFGFFAVISGIGGSKN